jgi:hypothetical protein
MAADVLTASCMTGKTVACAWTMDMTRTLRHSSPEIIFPEPSSHALRHRRYLVIRPIVAINYSTLFRCSITSPVANASATQWDT